MDFREFTAATNWSSVVEQETIQRELQGSVIRSYVRVSPGNVHLVRHLAAHVESRMDPFWSLLSVNRGEELLSISI